MADCALELHAVTKRYGEFVAVSELSFAVPRGAVYGVLGPNGAGKSTTLRMINDIIAPDSGDIRLFGSLAPGREAARRIGYLPEERGLYPKMMVGELLTFFGALRGLPYKTASARASEWLERLGIEDWHKNRVQDLSKGMQQKVQFASALLHQPELLILDEPWSGLDPINAEVLKQIVREQKRAGTSIVFSTHLMEQAEQVCDAVCIIARGERVLEGALADIKRSEAGDRLIAIAFSSPDERERAGDVLADEALVGGVRERRHHLEVELAAGADTHRLLAALVAAEVGIRRFEVFEPSLHQIFVDRVGAEVATAKQGRGET